MTESRGLLLFQNAPDPLQSIAVYRDTIFDKALVKRQAMTTPVLPSRSMSPRMQTQFAAVSW